MATRMVDPHMYPRRRDELAAGASILEAIAAVGTVVLAILGLVNILPAYMAGVGTIALGVSVLLEGGAIATRYSRVLSHFDESGSLSRPELGTGMTAEAFAGIAAIALGILALLGVDPGTLTAVAVVVIGGGLVLGSVSTTSLTRTAAPDLATIAPGSRIAREALTASAGSQAFVGVGAVVLGILALLGMDATVLTLIALLAVGLALLFNGTAIGARMMAVLHH